MRPCTPRAAPSAPAAWASTPAPKGNGTPPTRGRVSMQGAYRERPHEHRLRCQKVAEMRFRGDRVFRCGMAGGAHLVGADRKRASSDAGKSTFGPYRPSPAALRAGRGREARREQAGADPAAARAWRCHRPACMPRGTVSGRLSARAWRDSCARACAAAVPRKKLARW